MKRNNADNPIIEQANTVASALHNVSDIQEVDIATAEREVIWQHGAVKLYHFKATNACKAKTPVLVVYALVNRWHMMDLQPDRSFIRKLLSQGIDVYLVDWGDPSLVDRYKTMEDHILGDMDMAVDTICQQQGVDKVNLMGICQGGTFSLIYSALRPQKIRNLITLVTPVDFSTNEALLFKWAKDMDVDTVVDGFEGIVPGSFLNTAFDLLKPMNKTRKYVNLPKVAQNKAKLLNFLRMERWVADSPAQAGETYRQFIKEMYQENRLIKGEFVLGGEQVDLGNITVPVLTIYAKSDHIVPPSATRPIHDVVKSDDKELMEFPGGHIGVFVGSKSQSVLTPAIAKWLIARD